MAQTLGGAGFVIEEATSGDEALAWLASNTPSLVLLDLILPPPDGYAVLRALRSEPRTADVPVLVITSIDSDEEAARAFELGADDLVHKPFRPAELYARIQSQLRIRASAAALARKERDARLVLELTQMLCSAVDFPSILFTVTRKIAEVARVARCSIVLAREQSVTGYVIAQSDDEALRDLPIDLSQYPEIVEVMRTHKPLVIAGSSALFPIIFEDKAMGVLCLHGAAPRPPGEHEIALARTVASAVAIALRNVRMFQSMRDETEQVTVARAEAERRLSALQRYADFFHAAADGIVVLDGRGQVLFSNPRARELTGRTEAELASGDLKEMIDPNDHGKLFEIRDAFRSGRSLPTMDLTLRRSYETYCDKRVLSVNWSAVLLDESEAILVSFRDVTAARGNAVELIKTKEFLERVIDASASAIVSTDVAGTILLWSGAAERLAGYEAKEVVGQKNIRDVYPPGLSTKIRRQIHSRAFGGRGRLEGYRTHVIAKDGSYVPVRLSAALIMGEDGLPVGAVSLLVDLRDHLRVEVRLTEAEEELRAREKEALIHELAGAAAHELNQPLTSVLGYAALIQRRADEPEAALSAAAVIIQEAERMAAIVRKIGKITKYETKSYVGKARILDLDRSSEDETSPSSSHPVTMPPVPHRRGRT